jgi:hypothetical protein
VPALHQTGIEDYKDEYLRCRGLRSHTWQFKTDWNVVRGPRGRLIEFTQVLSCMSCTTQRHTTYEVTRTGHFRRKGAPQYKYAEGYQVHRGNPIELDDARDELIMRQLKQSLDAELMNRLENMRLIAGKQGRKDDDEGKVVHLSKKAV